MDKLQKYKYDGDNKIITRIKIGIIYTWKKDFKNIGQIKNINITH